MPTPRRRIPPAAPAILLLAGIAAAACGSQALRRSAENRLRGTVSDSTGQPLPGIFVTARDGARRVAVSVLTDADGSYRLPPLTAAVYRFEAHGYGFRSAARDSVAADSAGDLDFALARETGTLPASGAFEEIPIPVPQANPRALEIDPRGVWWVLLGGPEKVARFDPAGGDWKTYDIGMYPHSIGRDREGRIWYNGHFTKDPIKLGSLDTATGEVRTYDLPPNPETVGSPIPYELRAAPDGSLWISELVGNCIVRFDPASGKSRAWTMPSPDSGPRRLDVAADGTLWIPAYSGGSLVSFDPHAERFTEHPLPTRDALPYVARVDSRRRVVWVAEAGADAIARFEPATKRWTEFPLPTGSSLIRHMDIDPATGAVWAAYANAPPVTPKVIRLEPGTR